MIVRFATYEDAGIFAGLMRSEGHFSAILDEHIGFMWGPLVTGGFRVIVSDQPVGDEEDLPPHDLRLENLLDGLRTVVAAFMICGLFTAVVIAARAEEPDVAAWMLMAGYAGVLAVAFAALGPLMVPGVSAMRDERSLVGVVVRGLVLLYLIIRILWWAAALVFVITHLA
jgi:hypothetical protein